MVAVPVDLLLLDLKLSDSEGMAGLAAVRAEQPTVPMPKPASATGLPAVPLGDRVEQRVPMSRLRQRVAGRWQYDERHLCHSPQERLFIDGEWHEGLLPPAEDGAPWG